MKALIILLVAGVLCIAVATRSPANTSNDPDISTAEDTPTLFLLCKVIIVKDGEVGMVCQPYKGEL